MLVVVVADLGTGVRLFVCDEHNPRECFPLLCRETSQKNALKKPLSNDQLLE